MRHVRDAVETMVPDEVYTDRAERIDCFFETALNAIERRSMSTVLLGHRRMGKTEIFKRVVNRLVSEQDHADPKAVVPVFFEFPDEVVDRRDFAVNLPRDIAFTDDSTIAVFLDEFQNNRLPHRDFSITGFFQQAVESPRCPHFVTGSAMSILSDELIGKGALYGRFDYERIDPLTDYWGAELALRCARYSTRSVGTRR